MNNINKVSPVLKRYVPGQIQEKKSGKNSTVTERENKEEEDVKSKENNCSIRNSQVNFKFVPEFKLNDSEITPNKVNSREVLDKQFEKLCLNMRKRDFIIKLDLDLENIFKSHFEDKSKMTNVCESKIDFPSEDENILRCETKFLGRKRSGEELKESLSFKTNSLKAQKIDCNITSSSVETSFSYSPILRCNNNLSKSTTSLSLFDKFFIMFKKGCYQSHNVLVKVSQDKNQFDFSYERKNKVKVDYTILYSQSNQLIILLEKREDGNLKLKFSHSEVKQETFGCELKSMIDDITSNVEKK